MTLNSQGTAPAFNAADHALPERALEGVRSRRMFAILLDLFYLTLLTTVLVVVLFVLGLPTLGLSWLLLAAVLTWFPLVALLYNGITISGWRRATPGMRHMDLEMRQVDGTSVSFVHAAVHAVLYYIGVVFLSPLILLVSLVAINKRCLHDVLSGVVVTRRQQ